MAKKWVAKAFSRNKGALHKTLHVPSGKKITTSKLVAASKKHGVTGRRARLALTARGFKH